MTPFRIFNLLLFDGFETLDAFGPAEIMGRWPQAYLPCCSLSGGPITSAQNISTATRAG